MSTRPQDRTSLQQTAYVRGVELEQCGCLWTLSQGKGSADAYLKSNPSDWLDWYFDAKGQIKTAQLKFWMQAIV
jgi:hypothetical protein